MWIKICGVTRTEDVLAVIDSGADAIGFNFFPPSRRFVSVAVARSLAETARQAATDHPPVDLVGVFVNAAAAEVRKTADSVGLNAIQLHGDETPGQVADIHDLCPAVSIIRGFRVDPKNPERTLRDIDQLTALVPVSAILLDAFVPGEFGGTGTIVDLRILPEYFAQPRPPLILAGGLTPANVASVAGQESLWGVDTASGVESSPGIKVQSLIDQFVKAVSAGDSAAAPFRRIVRFENPSHVTGPQTR